MVSHSQKLNHYPIDEKLFSSEGVIPVFCCRNWLILFWLPWRPCFKGFVHSTRCKRRIENHYYDMIDTQGRDVISFKGDILIHHVLFSSLLLLLGSGRSEQNSPARLAAKNKTYFSWNNQLNCQETVRQSFKYCLIGTIPGNRTKILINTKLP